MQKMDDPKLTSFAAPEGRISTFGRPGGTDMPWIDTHCHLDAPEFDADRAEVLARARAAGVRMLVLPAVMCAHFAAVRELAHREGLAYALGLHPLYVELSAPQDLATVAEQLRAHRADPRLVAVGEIGLDGFVAGLDPARQAAAYVAQLELAASEGLPVILHVRRSADGLLRELRRIRVPGGIAHAFNGSAQQAHAFIDLGFKLGFGGAMSFERALQIRRLAQTLPLEALVLETDAPDIPPQWLYKTAAERAAGATSRNEPAELPRLGQVLAALRGLEPDELRVATAANACAALPRLAALMAAPAGPAEAPQRV